MDESTVLEASDFLTGSGHLELRGRRGSTATVAVCKSHITIYSFPLCFACCPQRGNLGKEFVVLVQELINSSERVTFESGYLRTRRFSVMR